MEVNRKTQENMSEGESKRPTSSIKEGILEKEKNEKEPFKVVRKAPGENGERFSRKMIGSIRKVKYLGDSK